MQISVIGCGRWGSCITWYLSSIGHSLTLYGREGSARMQGFMATRQNEYLTLPDSVELSTDLEKALKNEIIVISIGSQQLDGLCRQMAELGVMHKTFVLCMKGIEMHTCRRLTQIVADGLDPSNHCAVWLGPGHVQEITRGVPNCMVIDSADDAVKRRLVNAFSGGIIRFYYGTDLIGNEIGGAAKNVIGIAAGVLDGLELGTLKGALMSRGTREIARLIKAMDGNELSAYGLCHLGDYEATVFSPHSQNRRFGEMFAKGEKFDKLAEGYYTVCALRELGGRLGVELPICDSVYRLLYEGSGPKDELDVLFRRGIKQEF